MCHTFTAQTTTVGDRIPIKADNGPDVMMNRFGNPQDGVDLTRRDPGHHQNDDELPKRGSQRCNLSESFPTRFYHQSHVRNEKLYLLCIGNYVAIYLHIRKDYLLSARVNF